jgi:hypothetical protein
MCEAKGSRNAHCKIRHVPKKFLAWLDAGVAENLIFEVQTGTQYITA